MNNKIYCSTGTFTGQKNGYNHKLVIEYSNKLHCDGFEIMIDEDWYNMLDTVIYDYKINSISCPVIHADKNIGDTTESLDMDKYVELWKMNCNFGAEIGANKVVAHIWGTPNSDKNPEFIYKRYGILLKIAKEYNLDLLVENVVCTHKSPLEHLENLARIYPEIGLTIDTRHGQFHAEMDKICQSPIWTNGNIRHIHISEFAGGYKDWNGFKLIPQPGKGDVNYDEFFKHLKDINYLGTLTLEAPSIPQEEGVDIATLNDSLDFIRNGLR